MNKKTLWCLVAVFGLVLEVRVIHIFYDPATSIISQVLAATALVLIALTAPTLLVLLVEFIFTGPMRWSQKAAHIFA